MAKQVGPTWWLPIKPEDLDDEGVSAADQEKDIFVQVQDAKCWIIDGDGPVYYGYAVPVGGIFHTKGRELPKPARV
jgi:hypothetical protein